MDNSTTPSHLEGIAANGRGLILCWSELEPELLYLIKLLDVHCYNNMEPHEYKELEYHEHLLHFYSKQLIPSNKRRVENLLDAVEKMDDGSDLALLEVELHQCKHAYEAFHALYFALHHDVDEFVKELNRKYDDVA